jgi:hypothetical protein
MQQRQPRLGDILDDYCPRERRLTNHVVVAMVGDEIKQTRCATCDADHEYKHARMPKPRRKGESNAALFAQVAAVPRRVVPQPDAAPAGEHRPTGPDPDEVADTPVAESAPALDASTNGSGAFDDEPGRPVEHEGPVHRRLIRAALPRIDGQPPSPRQAPDFTIRQPGGRQNRFRPRGPRGGQGFQGHGSANGNVSSMRGGRPPSPSRPGARHGSGSGRRRSR